MNDTPQLLARLEKLEHENRRMKRLGEQGPLLLQSNQGKSSIRMAIPESGVPQMLLTDAAGKPVRR